MRIPDALLGHCHRFEFSGKGFVSIYLLLEGDIVVYVGQTVNLGQRIGLHRSSDIRFDSVYYFDVPSADADAYEGALMRTLNPAKSRRAPPDGSRDDEILASLGITPDIHARRRFELRTRRIWALQGKRAAATKRRDAKRRGVSP